MIFFFIYIIIDRIFCTYFLSFSVIFFFFVEIVLVQFCIILVRNDMFYRKHKSSNLVIVFYYVIGYVYIYSWRKKFDKILTHFGDALCKK